MPVNQEQRPVHILLVEDVQSHAFLFTKALSAISPQHEISVVDDGEKAVSFLLKRGAYQASPDPDLILLDLNLPKKNGLEVLKELRANDNLKHIPTIILSSSTSPEDIDMAYYLGANMYLHKPWTLEGVDEMIDVIAKTWLKVALLPHGASRDETSTTCHPHTNS